ncbi:hypothetical protein HSB1_38610 [Halogranum salarium B-1]|uniref:Uncharacterized protein n=2 Tax=Halogranum rubrum TaxID=553466 RepID=J3JDT8_9EURY|nr:hypothetical protein HSB1_38610 [Halogranum salarium B-1]
MYTISDQLNLVVRPGFDPESTFLQETIVERDGEAIRFSGESPSAEYLSTHNENQVYWWPPEE